MALYISSTRGRIFGRCSKAVNDDSFCLSVYPIWVALNYRTTARQKFPKRLSFFRKITWDCDQATRGICTISDVRAGSFGVLMKMYPRILFIVVIPTVRQRSPTDLLLLRSALCFYSPWRIIIPPRDLQCCCHSNTSESLSLSSIVLEQATTVTIQY